MPDKNGRFGAFGGRFVPETVMPALHELEEFYATIKNDPGFQAEFSRYLKEYAGRPTLLYYAENLTRHYGKAKIFLKREDLLHTGAHKINNALGQALIARRMGKRRVRTRIGLTYGTSAEQMQAVVSDIKEMLQNHPDIHHVIGVADIGGGRSNCRADRYSYRCPSKICQCG